MTRDTATYPPLMMSIGKRHKSKPRALRHLAETELGLRIQSGKHSPIDDARSALYLYHKHRKVRALDHRFHSGTNVVGNWRYLQNDACFMVLVQQVGCMHRKKRV